MPMIRAPQWLSSSIISRRKAPTNYNGGKVLASFISDGSGGLSLENGFFTACHRLKSEQKLHGISVCSADDSKKISFRYEKQSQALLTK
ncbi:hypothetical protein ACE6H2_019912 [Prunus campanulata]